MPVSASGYENSRRFFHGDLSAGARLNSMNHLFALIAATLAFRRRSKRPARWPLIVEARE
jgi:hypothetical protein